MENVKVRYHILGSVLSFNSCHLDSCEIFSQVLNEILPRIEDPFLKQSITKGVCIAQQHTPPFGAWILRLTFNSIICNINSSILHICCSNACNDPFILAHILCGDSRYQSLFPIYLSEDEIKPTIEDIKIDINQLNIHGQSCFHIACITSCQTGDLSLIHILLKAGIDINIIDNYSKIVKKVYPKPIDSNAAKDLLKYI